MVVVTVKRNTYGGEEYLRNACSYVTNPERAISPGGYGVDYTDAASCCNNMYATKKYFGKTSDNPLLHIVVSYPDSINDEKTACMYSKKCSSYFDSKYQNVYCTHQKDHDSSNYHTHILVNSVAYTDGNLISSWIGYMDHFCQHVTNVTGQKTRLELKNGANDFCFKLYMKR